MPLEVFVPRRLCSVFKPPLIGAGGGLSIRLPSVSEETRVHLLQLPRVLLNVEDQADAGSVKMSREVTSGNNFF